jgi:hypothetical protein
MKTFKKLVKGNLGKFNARGNVQVMDNNYVKGMDNVKKKNKVQVRKI